MFNNRISSDEISLSEAISTARMHDEALTRYQSMSTPGSSPYGELPRTTLVDIRFQHLTQIVARENERGANLLADVFNRSKDSK